VQAFPPYDEKIDLTQTLNIFQLVTVPVLFVVAVFVTMAVLFMFFFPSGKHRDNVRHRGVA
jgi:hypothetical protein